jgi:cytochrome c oxidase subunit III
MTESRHIPEPSPTLSMNPRKFALWLFIVTIVMLFAALTSAYIVKQADGNWLSIKLPGIFAVNTVIIVLSSAAMVLAYAAARRNNFSGLRWALITTMVLGIAFLAGQYYSWSELVSRNIYFVSNYAAGSFIYIFTGLHGLHLVSGLIFLGITLVSAFRLKIHSRNMDQLEMCATYWHFLGGLWIYLYFFLILNA